jgi:hypothetical protein
MQGRTKGAEAVSRPTRLRAVVLAAIGLAAIILGACTPTVSRSGDEGSTTSLPASPVTYASPTVTLDMRFEGTLSITPDAPCPVAVETSGSALCVAFPEGTTLDLSDPAQPILLMDDCEPLANGDYAEFVGTFKTWEVIEGSEQDRFRRLAELPREGATADGIAVVGSCQ